MKRIKVAKALDVPGWTPEKQHIYYKEVVKFLPNNPKVLEIGCGWGRSTWAWLDVLPQTTSYYILDSFELGYKRVTNINSRLNLKRIKCRNLSQREIFDEIIVQHPNSSIIKNVWHMKSEDWLQSKHFTSKWDLVYFDDDHSYDTVKRWLEKFSKVPIVCGDDYSINHIGVKKAVDEYANVNKDITPLPLLNFFIVKNT